MIDHLVYATPDLDGTAADLARRGLGLSPGGAHVGAGTRNALADLGDGTYLEVIGPDPDQPDPAAPRPFGIDDLAGPVLAAWAARVGDLDAAVRAAEAEGHDPGPATDMSRARADGVLLTWQLTPFPGDVPSVVPFLIAWGDTDHPSRTAAPGARLTAFTGRHPDPAEVRRRLTALGVAGDLTVSTGPAPGLRALITTPTGTVELR